MRLVLANAELPAAGGLWGPLRGLRSQYCDSEVSQYSTLSTLLSTAEYRVSTYRGSVGEKRLAKSGGWGGGGPCFHTMDSDSACRYALQHSSRERDRLLGQLAYGVYTQTAVHADHVQANQLCGLLGA